MLRVPNDEPDHIGVRSGTLIGLSGGVGVGLVVLLGLWGCGASHPSGDGGPRDAGRLDVGVRDVGARDVGVRDVGARDVGARDVGARDVGASDVGAGDGGGLDPGWVPMPGLPESCLIERAEHPERVFTPQWRTEPSCGPGCAYLAPPPPGLLRAYDPRIAWYVGERGYFQIIQGTRGGRETFLLTPTDGPAIAAWRQPPAAELTCRILTAGYGAGDVAFVIHVVLGGGVGREYIYRAPLAEIGQVTEPLHVLDERDIVGSNGVARLLLSPRWVVAVMTPGDYYLFLDGEQRRVVGGPGAPVPAGPRATLLGEDDLFWEDWSAGVRLARGDSEGHERVFLSRLPEAETIGSSFLPSRIAWLQAYDRLPGSAGWARYELWTAPWPALGEPVVGRKVADVVPYSGAEGSDHVYAQLTSDAGGSNRHVKLWDLADGRLRVFDPPGDTSGVGWGVTDPPSALSDGEMLVLTGTTALGPRGVLTLARVQLDALPTVPP